MAYLQEHLSLSEMMLRSWFPTNGLFQLSMRASTANTWSSSLGILGDCILSWWNWGHFACTKLLSWSKKSTPVLCRKVKSIYSTGLVMIPVFVVFVDTYVNGVIHENPPKRSSRQLPAQKKWPSIKFQCTSRWSTGRVAICALVY